jgi:hypothetical protein
VIGIRARIDRKRHFGGDLRYEILSIVPNAPDRHAVAAAGCLLRWFGWGEILRKTLENPKNA